DVPAVGSPHAGRHRRGGRTRGRTPGAGAGVRHPPGDPVGAGGDGPAGATPRRPALRVHHGLPASGGARGGGVRSIRRRAPRARGGGSAGAAAGTRLRGLTGSGNLPDPGPSAIRCSRGPAGGRRSPPPPDPPRRTGAGGPVVAPTRPSGRGSLRRRPAARRSG